MAAGARRREGGTHRLGYSLIFENPKVQSEAIGNLIIKLFSICLKSQKGDIGPPVPPPIPQSCNQPQNFFYLFLLLS